MIAFNVVVVIYVVQKLLQCYFVITLKNWSAVLSFYARNYIYFFILLQLSHS